MGNYAPRIGITAMLSRHNSPRDDIHNRLYEQMVRRIRSIVSDPEYAQIHADFYEDGIDWERTSRPEIFEVVTDAGTVGALKEHPTIVEFRMHPAAVEILNGYLLQNHPGAVRVSGLLGIPVTPDDTLPEFGWAGIDNFGKTVTEGTFAAPAGGTGPC